MGWVIEQWSTYCGWLQNPKHQAGELLMLLSNTANHGIFQCDQPSTTWWWTEFLTMTPGTVWSVPHLSDGQHHPQVITAITMKSWVWKHLCQVGKPGTAFQQDKDSSPLTSSRKLSLLIPIIYQSPSTITLNSRHSQSPLNISIHTNHSQSPSAITINNNHS